MSHMLYKKNLKNYFAVVWLLKTFAQECGLRPFSSEKWSEIAHIGSTFLLNNRWEEDGVCVWSEPFTVS